MIVGGRGFGTRDRNGAPAGTFAPKVRPAGLEPATGGLENRCSIQLSYGRERRGGVAAIRMPSSRLEREIPAPEASGLSN
jgi:hypothetical protein